MTFGNKVGWPPGNRAAGPAPWSSDPRCSRGRRWPESPPVDRTEFQRDRDRVVHCTAFRRLAYKTQVFVNHEGDLFRTRLTHSIEVAQLSRLIARRLMLDEDLVEAIALAHDLGHAPFGHAGQDALQACMDAHGGFEHNLQSLRIVDHLEQRHPAFDGLNLTFEAREGILKHCSRARARQLEALEPLGVARRFLDDTRPSLEAQVVNLADEITYNAHDIDDGLRSGLLDAEALARVPMYARLHDEVVADHPGIEHRGRRLVFEILRRMRSHQVAELVRHSAEAIQQAGLASADDARRARTLVELPPEARREFDQVKGFLLSALYRHPQVVETTDAAREVVTVLFAAYVAAPQEMPDDFATAADRWRGVSDYIAGMTDRFALREHHRLTGRTPFPRALFLSGGAA